MGFQKVPSALQERLGAEGTSDLVRLLNMAEAEWSDNVLNRSQDRFERRVVDVAAGVRVDVAREAAALQGDVAGLRTEMKVGIQEGVASIRQELATSRVELLKWSFLFWVGQVFAIVALVGAMLGAMGQAL